MAVTRHQVVICEGGTLALADIDEFIICDSVALDGGRSLSAPRLLRMHGDLVPAG